MLTTGEMRNHQALGLHKDTNRSGSYEIYSFLHQAGVERKDGYLCMPLDDVCIKVKCDKYLLVCDMSDTPHVPDPSRDVHNISRVHGPLQLKTISLFECYYLLSMACIY